MKYRTVVATNAVIREDNPTFRINRLRRYLLAVRLISERWDARLAASITWRCSSTSFLKGSFESSCVSKAVISSIMGTECKTVLGNDE